jgi:hypothetical protein
MLVVRAADEGGAWAQGALAISGPDFAGFRAKAAADVEMDAVREPLGS